MTTAAALIAYAGRWEGTQEKPRGTNLQPFAAMAHQANGYAWCATFLCAMADATKLALPEGAHSAYCPTMESAFKRAGRLSTTPRPGAFGFVYFPSMRGVHHTFLVTAVIGSDVLTLEGNSNEDGSREGYEVVRRRRSIHAARSYGLPAYSSPKAAKPRLARYLQRGSHGTAVFALQRILRAAGYQLSVDGQLGPVTERALRAWQRKHKLDDDGIVGRRTATALGWAWAG